MPLQDYPVLQTSMHPAKRCRAAFRAQVLPRALFRLVATASHPGHAPHSSRNPYPYPLHARPTPHQIFHLPYGASQADIKARYYELVRIHHPDSIHCRSVSPEIRHSRFQSITAAYDVLRGRKPHAVSDPYTEEIMRRKRAYYSHYGHRPRAEYAYNGYGYGGRHNWHASPDDRWKDRVILIVGVTTLIAGLAPGLYMFPSSLERRHQAAAANLAQARSEAREMGDERMRQLRKRAMEIRKASERENGTEDAEPVTSPERR